MGLLGTIVGGLVGEAVGAVAGAATGEVFAKVKHAAATLLTDDDLSRMGITRAQFLAARKQLKALYDELEGYRVDAEATRFSSAWRSVMKGKSKAGDIYLGAVGARNYGAIFAYELQYMAAYIANAGKKAGYVETMLNTELFREIVVGDAVTLIEEIRRASDDSIPSTRPWFSAVLLGHMRLPGHKLSAQDKAALDAGRIPQAALEVANGVVPRLAQLTNMFATAGDGKVDETEAKAATDWLNGFANDMIVGMKLDSTVLA